MQIREIGSEFEWVQIREKNKLDWLPTGTDTVFTFSGRTAIETALQNMKSRRRAYVPSYCCDSMLVPFRRENVELFFYPVEKGDAGISVKINASVLMTVDVFFICNYFGFSVDYPEELIAEFKNNGGIVIEDVTHSLLSKSQFHACSDWITASLRKWGPLADGGICVSRTAEINVSLEKPDGKFISLKMSAMKDKYRYLQGETVNKADFLNRFAESNQMIEDDYSGKAMSTQSYEILCGLDIERMRTQRIQNAKALYHGLEETDRVRPLFDMGKMECPLFVPVVLPKNKRDELRSILIENRIYCPVHWPRPYAEVSCSLYDEELSLLCDQRYTVTEMQRIIKVICEG